MQVGYMKIQLIPATHESAGIYLLLCSSTCTATKELASSVFGFP